MNIRPAITIFDEDSALTLLKPYSDEYRDQLFVIHEDAYGEMTGILEYKSELKRKLNITNEEFEELLLKLK